MPTSYQTIIDNGFNKSSAARPETLNAQTELISRVNECLREAFQVMSRENVYIVGVRAQLSFDGNGWPRPANCLRVIKIVADAGTIASPVIPVGQEINIVPFDDALFCAGRPSLTELGQSFLSVGQTMDPSSGTLSLIYARQPIQGMVGTDLIDPFFPNALDDFLQYDMAAYLATKDRRADDEQSFLSFKSSILSQLIDWCRQQSYSLQQRFPIITPPLTNTNAGRSPSAPQGQ